MIFPGPTKPPLKGKRYTRKDLPLDVVHVCGCLDTLDPNVLLRCVNVQKMVDHISGVACYWCQAHDIVNHSEERLGLRPLHRDPGMSGPEVMKARYNRLSFFEDWQAATEEELDNGIREVFNRKMLEVLDASARNKRSSWKKPRFWIHRPNAGTCWHELQLSFHLVQETMKDREAYFDVIANPNEVAAGHLKLCAGEHVKTMEDCLLLISSPSEDIRNMGLELSREIRAHIAKPQDTRAA